MDSRTAFKQPFFRRKWFLIACALLLLYTLAGFFLAPAVLKSQLESKLPAVLHRNVTVQEVRINPYVLSLGIKGFQVTEPDGQLFASLDELFVNLQLSSLFQRSLNFKEISLKKPAVAIVVLQDGKTNFDNLLSGHSAPQPQTEPSKPPKINIEKLQIDDGGVTFADFTRTPNFEAQVYPIQLSLTDFSTQPDAKSPYSFSAHTEPGATVSWSGAFSVDPLRSNGVLTVSGVQLKTFAPYYAEFARFHVADGEAGFRAEYRLDASSGSLDLQINHAALEVKHLKLTPPDTQEPVVTLASLTVGEANADLLKRVVTVDNVALDDGAILARRQRDGTLNLQTLVNPRTNQAGQAGAPSPPKTEDPKKTENRENPEPWRLAVKDVTVTNFSVTAEDAVPATPAKLILDRINLKVNGLAFPDRTPIATEASLRWNQAGTVAATGTLRHAPVFADLRVAVKDFDLRPFQPYLDEQANVQLTGGNANLQGHVIYGAPEAGAPMLRFTGAFSLNQVAAVDTISSKSVVAWDTFALNGIHADVSPTAIAIDEIRLKKLKSSVVVASDGRVNVTNLMRTSAKKDVETPPESSKSEPAQSSPTPISVKAVVLEDSTVAFTDRSIQPNYAAEIRKLGGRIQGLSSQSRAKAKVAMSGKLDGHAPLSISGHINPLSKDLFADLEFSLKSFDLPPLSPYTGKYAGYPFQKGKLSADLRYKVAERKMDAENVVLVDQLTLGPHTDSPDATSLPVKLAIAILQDRQGKIHLDVPVSGKLDDPEFKLGKVIWRAFLNILEKVATSPFALVGAIAGSGGGGEELSVIAFPAGSAVPGESETQKLDKLAKVLMDRPGLNLEIAAQADPVDDRPALAKEKLRTFFKQQKMKAMKTRNPSLEEDIPLQDQEYERMVRLAYAELAKAAERSQSSPNAVDSGMPALSDDAFQEPEKKSGFWEFFSRLNPFKSSRPSKKDSSQAASREGSESGSPGVAFADMEQSLIERQDVTEEDFNALKRDRAKNVQSYLLKAGTLGEERLFIVAPAKEDKTGGDSQVKLSLK
ncbi:MAG: DUF748 domain-containing protein [Nitrospiraceae bacterium]